MHEVAYAKINLALHVRGREADGYHRIETLFAFAEDGDLLRVEEAEGLSLDVQGPFASALEDEEDNLVLRAARALREHARVGKGARLVLDKRLPVASGIGGGSADAAAALRLLNLFWELGLSEEALTRLGRGLGADVVACISSRTSIGRGRGDELSPAEGFVKAGTPFLLVNPGVAVSTGEIFRRWQGEDGGALPADWRQGRNDLEGPATGLVREIGDVLAALKSAGGEAARMSGSGATCFALFGSEVLRDSAAKRIGADHPSWWQLATRVRLGSRPDRYQRWAMDREKPV
jgi:4-diphosphocytidyl-2-C-methyl-D-erythritol kinase